MYTGISTSCLFPELTEKALEELLSLGAKRIEVFLNSPSEATPQFAKMLRGMTDAHGAEILSVHPYSSEMEGVSFFGRYPRRYDDALEEYRRMFELCNIVGAKRMVFHGARKMSNMEPKRYAECFAIIREEARREGICLAQENVARCYCGFTPYVRELRRLLPDIDFVFDCKQALRAGHTFSEMIEVMGDRICHVHLSGHTPACDCLPPRADTIDLAALLEALKGVGYDGVLMLELYRWNFERVEELAESEKFLQQFLSHP